MAHPRTSWITRPSRWSGDCDGVPDMPFSWLPVVGLVASSVPAPPALDAPPPAPEVALAARDRGPAPDGAAGPRFTYGRAAVELGGLLALGAGWYEVEIEFNRQDFDFDRTCSSQWEKLVDGRGYRFDDNDRQTNIAHAFVGRTYHGIARANHATLLEAALFDLFASSVWESTIESREVFSINDTVVTGIGGIPLGEASYQMGEFFARSAPSLQNRLFLLLCSPARALLALTEGGRLPRPGALDKHGFATDAYHRFVLSAGGSFVLPPPGQPADAATGGVDGRATASLDMELVNLRTYGHEGHVRYALRGGEATRLGLGYAGTTDRVDELSVAARSSLFGMFAQDLAGEAGQGHGQSLLLAAGSAFDLAIDDREKSPDFVTAIHAIGPTADLVIYRGPLTVRLASDVYGDFAMVRPFALDPAAPPSALEGTKSVLEEHQYYYALGLTTAARAEANYGPVRAGVRLEWNGYDSIQGLDRAQDAYTTSAGVYHPGVTDDFEIVDQRFKLRLYTELPTFVDEVRLGLSFDVQRRTGEMKDVTRTEDEGRASAVLSFVM